jgi:hypothetical protein
MIHALALEGRDTLVSCPAEYLASNGAMSTKAAKDWKAQVESEGYTVANAETTERIKRASAAVLAYLASQQIDPENGIVERPIYWERADGIACRALPDLLFGKRLCIDLKTTSDLSDKAISSACFGDFAYWLQVVHYLEGIKETYGWDASFVFVFVETERPYGVRAYSLSADDHAWAFEKRERLIEDLKRRTETGDWSTRKRAAFVSLSVLFGVSESRNSRGVNHGDGYRIEYSKRSDRANQALRTDAA